MDFEGGDQCVRPTAKSGRAGFAEFMEGRRKEEQEEEEEEAKGRTLSDIAPTILLPSVCKGSISSGTLLLQRCMC